MAFNELQVKYNSHKAVCSVCGKHSEYKTDFCCNCGTKMSIEENKNGT